MYVQVVQQGREPGRSVSVWSSACVGNPVSSGTGEGVPQQQGGWACSEESEGQQAKAVALSFFSVEIESHYVVLTNLELEMWMRLASNS